VYVFHFWKVKCIQSVTTRAICKQIKRKKYTGLSKELKSNNLNQKLFQGHGLLRVFYYMIWKMCTYLHLYIYLYTRKKHMLSATLLESSNMALEQLSEDKLKQVT